MIQIYAKGNTVYEKNGNATLEPEICDIEAEINGTWCMKMEYPIDEEGKWKYIEEGAVIAAPSFVNEKQLFRIRKRTKADDGIEVIATPIFFDSANDIFFMDKRPEKKTGQQVLDELLKEQNKYKGHSDISTVSTAYYIRKNLIEALQSDEDNSFINRWGGEAYYDNYHIYINKRIGKNRGMRVEMGYNCMGIEEETDMSTVATRIVPVAYNGYTLSGDTPWVDSPLINSYPIVYTKTMDFSNLKMREDIQEEDEKDGVIICDTKEELDEELKQQCKIQFENGIDKPDIGYICDLVELAHTEEYKDIKNLETVGLGDTVSCKSKRLDITTEARVVKIVYDCIKKRNKNVELGKFLHNYINDMTSAAERVDKAIRPNGTVVAEQIQGFINAVEASLKLQSSVAKKVDGRAFLIEDLDKKSPMYGGMEAGTQGLRISKIRREDNEDWIWTTSITALGIIADTIVTGRISDKTGRSYWDLDNGEMVLSGRFRQYNKGNGYKSVDINNNQIKFYSWQKDGEYVGSIASTEVKGEVEGRKNLSIYCDLGDKIIIGYIAEREETGRNIIRSFITFDAAEAGNDPLDYMKKRSIHFSEIPHIEGAANIDMQVGQRRMRYRGGILVKVDNGSKSPKTGRAEFSDGSYLEISNGEIVGGKTASGSTF